MKIIMNPPFQKGLAKKIFKIAGNYGKVHSLQPIGAWRTHVGYVSKLYPLHTSVKRFDIALMALGILTNNKDEQIFDWDLTNVPTVLDYEQGTVPLKMRDLTTGNARMIGNTVPLSQHPEDIAIRYGAPRTGGVLASTGISPKQVLVLLNVGPTASGDQGVINGMPIKQKDLAPLELTNSNNGRLTKNTATLRQQPATPLRCCNYTSGHGNGTGNGVPLQQETLIEKDLSKNTATLRQEPLEVGPSKSHEEVFNTCAPKTPLFVGDVKDGHSGEGGHTSNGICIDQDKLRKTCIFFNSKEERTNFIKNISKIIGLQILFFSGLFPTAKDRIMPPVDREYSKDELLDYFGFPKDIYYDFDDIEKEEPNSHYTSYERWRDWRKEKYGLDWEEK